MNQAVIRQETLRLIKPQKHLPVWVALLFATASLVTAEDAASAAKPSTNAVGAKAEKPPPLPLHQIEGNGGVDFTLYASKMFTFLPRPVLLNVGGRATEGAHLGLLGFTSGYEFVAEANLVVFVTDRLALAAEYRQKPNAYTPVPGLIGRENDWWTIDAAYVVSKHFTVAAGYGHFGRVLNHEANGTWGITTKFEF